MSYFDNPYFSKDELRCKGSMMLDVNEDFLYLIIALRKSVDAPFIVTSCCRSSEHNKHIGGHKNSLHICDINRDGVTGALAIDIKRGSPEFNHKVVRMALDMGLSAGIPKSSFIHIDARHLVGMSPQVFGYG